MRSAAVLAALLALSACADGAPTASDRAEGEVQARAASQDDLFTLVATPALNAEQQQRVAALRERASTAEVRIATLSGAAGGLLQHGRAVVLNVGAGKRFVAVGERVAERGAADRSFSGPLQNEDGWADVVLTPMGVTGTLRAGREVYSFQPLGGGLQAIVRVDATRLPPEHASTVQGGAASIAPQEPPAGLAARVTQAPMADPFAPVTAANVSGIWLDVLVVYTAAVAAAHPDMTGLIQLAMDQTNASYTNSDVWAGVWLAGTAQVAYNEAGRTFTQHLSAMQNASDGMMDNVPGLRNTHLADIVVLLVSDSEACGEAAAIPAVSTNAYAAVDYTCITSNNYSFGHEIGHLQGARHNRAYDNNSTPYAYGHGYVAPSLAWRTIMAYPQSCNGCTRLNYWSNPNKTWGGVPMGTAAYEDNARVLNNTKYAIRNFRALPAPQNFTHTNKYVANVNPSFTWTPVPGADGHTLERCIVTSGQGYNDSCFYGVGGSESGWTEREIVQTGGDTYYNCARKAMYRVRAYNRTGTSGYTYQHDVCIF